MPAEPRVQDPHVELVDIGKSFGGVRALDQVSLTIARGSIHALVGENGAGKSTLGKILAGVIAPDHGQLLLDGEPVAFRSPREAMPGASCLIAQELSIAPALSVAENVFLGTEPRRAGFVAGARCAAATTSSPPRPASSSAATCRGAPCGRRISRRWRSCARCAGTPG